MMDNPGDIEFKPVVEMLQHENEQLRLTVLKLRNAHTPLESLNADSVKAFLTKNYVVIMAATSILFVVFALISTVKGFFTKDKE